MKKGKVLALDYGLKRLGVATGDLDMSIAFPRSILQNKDKQSLLKDLSDLVSELDVDLIVVGLPLNMNNEAQENDMTLAVKSFVSLLEKEFPYLEVVLYDERLSSFEADSLISDAVSRGGGDFGRDAYAAQIILQRFFDNLRKKV